MKFNLILLHFKKKPYTKQTTREDSCGSGGLVRERGFGLCLWYFSGKVCKAGGGVRRRRIGLWVEYKIITLFSLNSLKRFFILLYNN